MEVIEKTKVIYRLINESKKRQKTFNMKLTSKEVKTKLSKDAIVISVIGILPTIIVRDDLTRGFLL